MNPSTIGPESCYSYKDAIFFSGHKFIGGPGNFLSSFLSFSSGLLSCLLASFLPTLSCLTHLIICLIIRNPS